MRAWARGGGILVQIGEHFVSLIRLEGFRKRACEMGDGFSLKDEKLDLNTRKRKKMREMARIRNLRLRV